MTQQEGTLHVQTPKQRKRIFFSAKGVSLVTSGEKKSGKLGDLPASSQPAPAPATLVTAPLFHLSGLYASVIMMLAGRRRGRSLAPLLRSRSVPRRW